MPGAALPIAMARSSPLPVLRRRPRLAPFLALLALAGLVRPAGAAQLDPEAVLFSVPRNLLVIVADDLGVDMLSAYGEGADLPTTPWIDLLAANGVLFRNAYANPVCTPTRAALLTGRHAFRTGMGFLVESGGGKLPDAEITLPEAIRQWSPFEYATGAFGKWHLAAGSAGPPSPLQQGFDHYAGALSNFSNGQGYYDWTQFVNGVGGNSQTYATTAHVDAALGWIQAQDKPWLCYLAFNAPHSPWVTPPANLFTSTFDEGALSDVELGRARYKAMVEAIDAELGRLLLGIPPEELARTLIVFTGDNGTPKNVTVPPFLPEHAKLTPYEGGCNVPLIFSSLELPLVGVQTDALAQCTDLFKTLLQFSGVDLMNGLTGAPVLDSETLLGPLIAPGSPGPRTTAFAEYFQPNFPAPGQPVQANYAIRDARYKLVRRTIPFTEEFYDLQADPFEQVDLLRGASLTPEQVQHYVDLHQALDQLLNS